MSGTNDDLAKRILAEYNSIERSRRGWIRNRSWLRNNWKELFDLMEALSGRPGRKVELFDENWHEIGEKAPGVRGAVNKNVDDIDIRNFATTPDDKAERRREALQASADQNNGAKDEHAEDLRRMSQRDYKLGEEEKDVKTAPAHVSVPGEEDPKELDRVEGDPHPTETDSDGVMDAANKLDDRTQQAKLQKETNARIKAEQKAAAKSREDESQTAADEKAANAVGDEAPAAGQSTPSESNTGSANEQASENANPATPTTPAESTTPADGQGKSTSQSQGSENGESVVKKPVDEGNAADTAAKQATQSEKKSEAERGPGKTVKPEAAKVRAAKADK